MNQCLALVQGLLVHVRMHDAVPFDVGWVGGHLTANNPKLMRRDPNSLHTLLVLKHISFEPSIEHNPPKSKLKTPANTIMVLLAVS